MVSFILTFFFWGGGGVTPVLNPQLIVFFHYRIHILSNIILYTEVAMVIYGLDDSHDL